MWGDLRRNIQISLHYLCGYLSKGDCKPSERFSSDTNFMLSFIIRAASGDLYVSIFKSICFKLSLMVFICFNTFLRCSSKNFFHSSIEEAPSISHPIYLPISLMDIPVFFKQQIVENIFMSESVNSLIPDLLRETNGKSNVITTFDNLTFIETDLSKDDNWDEAMNGF